MNLKSILVVDLVHGTRTVLFPQHGEKSVEDDLDRHINPVDPGKCYLRKPF